MYLIDQDSVSCVLDEYNELQKYFINDGVLNTYSVSPNLQVYQVFVTHLNGQEWFLSVGF